MMIETTAMLEHARSILKVDGGNRKLLAQSLRASLNIDKMLRNCPRGCFTAHLWAPRSWLLLALVVGCLSFWPAQATATNGPKPGDLFREYKYTNTYGDAGGAIRVGGKRGVSYPDRGSDFNYVNAWIDFPHAVDLEHAVRAEVVVEKIQSHNGTRGFAIQWNDSSWLHLPVPNAIPEPRHEYYHHACITISVPLEHIGGEAGQNRFRLKVDPEHAWNWPQHLVYGVHLRIYYNPERKAHVHGRLAEIQGKALGIRVPLAVEIENSLRRVNRVDYVAKYTGVNWEGDGRYRRWHYFYYHGLLIHHLATSLSAPSYAATWDTSWIPDQQSPIEIAARITDDTGLTLMTAASGGWQLERPGLRVELCRPQDVPANWVSRRDAFIESIEIEGDLSQAVAARLVWSSWSPGYMNGVYVNEHLVIESEGPKYRYFDHRVPIPDLSVLKPGKNTVGTGKTPLIDDRMVHGMEVNWPGIQLLIQYRADNASK